MCFQSFRFYIYLWVSNRRGGYHPPAGIMPAGHLIFFHVIIISNKEAFTMEKGRFFALLSRMKYIGRWGLMRGTRTENLCEHSLETVYITHALAEIHNTFDTESAIGTADVKKAVLYAAYHDAQEVFTGDLPTPVKYRNPEIRDAYKAVEHAASERLLDSLPDDLRTAYAPYLAPDPDCLEWKLVKAADKLSGLIKCREELAFGNREFAAAEQAQLAAIKNLHLPAAELFVKKYLPFYAKSLDDLLET